MTKHDDIVAVVLMYSQLRSRHLRSRAKKLSPKEARLIVEKKHRISRSTFFRYLKTN